MIIGILLAIWIVIAAIWTLDFLFNRIEAKYDSKKRKIEQVSRFVSRNNISAEEAEFLYQLAID